jgi:hypothetical protein
MHPDTLNALSGKLEREIKNTNLVWEELQFDSFIIYYAYNFSMSASDTVHALTGLLCMPASVDATIGENPLSRFWYG